ncbi:hypothetical protein ACKWTF_008254 [Chironomus riparius]
MNSKKTLKRPMNDDDNNVFEEMKIRYQQFIKPLPEKVKNIKHNVFYNAINSNRTEEKMSNMARETRPFLAKEIWNMLDDYMDFMRNLSRIEGENYRAIYKDLTRHELIKRLIFKRPVVFYGPPDRFLLRCEGNKMMEGKNDFKNVAKNLDKISDSSPYLREYISYDENLLSSLIGMSTPTYYFSIGGKGKARLPFIDEGILCGIVGARNSKPNFMEHRFTLPRSKDFDAKVFKSDKFWIEKVYSDAFPEKVIPTIQDIQTKPDIYNKIYINGVNEVYLEKRLMLSVLPYMQEAMSRGVEKDKDVFCSVPAIGAGVWAKCINGSIIHRLIVKGVLKFLDSYDDHPNLKHLKALALPVEDPKMYSGFAASGNIKEIKVVNENIVITFKEPVDHKLKIINRSRYVAELLPEEFRDCISIAGYAWDGNSYPGNEYWFGMMGSFDPQAINCSLLGQFQNPEVNVKLADPERIHIY